MDSMQEAAPNPARSGANSSTGSSSPSGNGTDSRPPADAEYLARAGRGDASAMAAIFDRYSPLVYPVALRALGEPGAAESVTQNVFMKLWRDPGSFPAVRSSLGAWLVMAARNQAVERRRALPAAADPEEVALASACDLSNPADLHAAADKVERALEGLPRQARSTLEMIFFDGLNQSEAATRSGDPPATVKIRIRLALTEIRKAMLA